VRHRRGSIQQIHLPVRCPLSLRPFRLLLIDRYPELRELELRQLARVLLSSESDPTLGVLKTKIKNYADGQLQHAEHVLPALYELMENDEPVKEAPLPEPASSNQKFPGIDGDGLKKALTSSLTSGTFLDSQFYAAESRSSTGLLKIRPIYFCSMVGVNPVCDSFVSELTACGSPAWIACVGALLIDCSRFLET
jgi:hypothetical protein